MREEAIILGAVTGALLLAAFAVALPAVFSYIEATGIPALLGGPLPFAVVFGAVLGALAGRVLVVRNEPSA